jgi:hypothetical protein
LGTDEAAFLIFDGYPCSNLFGGAQTPIA